MVPLKLWYPFLDPLEYMLEHPRNGNRSVSVSLSTTEIVGFCPWTWYDVTLFFVEVFVETFAKVKWDCSFQGVSSGTDIRERVPCFFGILEVCEKDRGCRLPNDWSRQKHTLDGGSSRATIHYQLVDEWTAIHHISQCTKLHIYIYPPSLA